jgi:aspartate racemase
MSRKKLKTIGVLGGMGPEAGARFLEEIIRACGAGRDQDHPPVILYSLPQVPDRTEAILHGGPDPVPALRHGLAVLAGAGADFAVIACISAHYFLPRLAPRSPLALFSLIDETLIALQAMRSSPKTIGLIATTGAVRSGLIARPFEAAGLRVIVPSPKGERPFSRSPGSSSGPAPRPCWPAAPRSRSSSGLGTCPSRFLTPWPSGPGRPSGAPAPPSAEHRIYSGSP